MKIKKFCLLAGAFLLLGGGLARAENSLYLPLIMKNNCTSFTFLTFGDSITAGYPYWDTIPHSGYVGSLYDALHTKFPQQDLSFYNMGIGGQTTDDGLVRIEANLTEPIESCYYQSGCLYPPTHEALLPQLVLIMMGTNDIDQSHPYDVIYFNLWAMVSKAKQLNKQVILATIPPVCSSLTTFNGDSFLNQIDGFRNSIAQIALAFKIPLADVYEAFRNNPNWESDYMYTDCEHPNEAGYQVIEQTFLSQILPGMTSEGCYVAPN